MREEGSEDSLADTFWTVARRLRHVSADALARWDVAPSQSRALGVLARHGEMRPGELARHLRIAPRSATEVVDGLAERGFVERVPDPHDRRATVLRLTAHGQETAAAVRAARDDEVARFFGRLSPADRAELTRILGELRREVEREAHREPPGTSAGS